MITAETIPETGDIELKPEETDKLYSLIFGSKEFSPSALMAQTLAEYITQEDNLLPHQILKKNGRARENWYIWSKRPGFLDWWNGVIEGVFTKQRLSDLYNALYRRGLSNDTAAAKIVIQRFDPRFTERSQSDQRHSFAGYEPAAADDSRNRQRKALASTSLPDAPEQRTGGPDTPALPEPAQAQEQSTIAEQAQPEQASNDTSADSKPITPIKGAGEGV